MRHDRITDKSVQLKPVALILAGYDKFDAITKRRHRKEIREAYDGEDIYLGENKFLHLLSGKPIIEYVIEAVYNARKGKNRIYDRIYVYNDIRSFNAKVDVSRYDNLVVRQMTDSVAGHWKDFYSKIESGQRVDVFFGDTPRITSEDVEYVYDEYTRILGKERDFRGVPVHMIYGIVEFSDMSDNWLEHRIKYVKRGPNRGKLKSFVGYENFQARVGNSGSFVKHPSNDAIIEHEPLNFIYNLRKALTPSTFSRIMYYLWKAKKFRMIRQVKNKCINEEYFYETVLGVIENALQDDLSDYGCRIFHIRKNAARWENDVDGPLDLKALQKKFYEYTN